MRDRLFTIVSQATGIPQGDLRDDTNLVESSHIDSLSLMNMLIEIEEEFRIELGYSELHTGCQTLGGLERAVQAKQLAPA